jgi:flagellar biosynthesis chaperone FliJ
MTIEELQELKEEIEACKTDKARLEGERNVLMNQLKTNWGCDTIEQAEKKQEHLQKQIDDLNKEIETALDELEQKYEF